MAILRPLPITLVLKLAAEAHVVVGSQCDRVMLTAVTISSGPDQIEGTYADVSLAMRPTDFPWADIESENNQKDAYDTIEQDTLGHK